ncbi:dihydrofolate reductase family protein [Neomicrococcus aestuarii]
MPMGTLSYTTAMPLDGFVADADGDFQWAAPNEEIFRFHIERVGDVSAEVLGRKTYELMKYWDTEPAGEDWGEQEREFAALWQGVKLFVASGSLESADVADPRTTLVDRLNLDFLRRIVADASGEVEIFGPTVARDAIVGNLVDDYRFFVVPVTVGGGLAAIPANAKLDLALVEQRVFSNGTLFVHYKKA